MYFSTKSCIKGLLSALVVSAQSDLDKKVFCVNQDAKVDRVDLNDGVCSFRLPSNYSTSFHYRNANDYEVTFYYATLGNKVYLTDIEDQDNVIYIPARDLYEKDEVVIYGVSRSNGSENVTWSSDMVIAYFGDDSEYDGDHWDNGNDDNRTDNDRDDNDRDDNDRDDNDRVTDKEDNDDTLADYEDHRRSLYKRDNDAFIHHLIHQQGEELQRGIFRVADINSGSTSSTSGFITMTTSGSLSTTMSSNDSKSSSSLKSSRASPSDSLTTTSSTSTDSSSTSTSSSTSSSSTSTGTAVAEDSASISSVPILALVLFSIVGLM